MLAMRLPPEIKRRLEKLSRRTGTSPSTPREAILEHIEDPEDTNLAQDAGAEHEAACSPTVSMEEMMRLYSDGGVSRRVVAPGRTASRQTGSPGRRCAGAIHARTAARSRQSAVHQKPLTRKTPLELPRWLLPTAVAKYNTPCSCSSCKWATVDRVTASPPGGGTKIMEDRCFQSEHRAGIVYRPTAGHGICV